MISTLSLVALGGAIGASLRHGAGLAALRMGLAGWPWATFAVNLLGSLLMGLLIGFLAFRGEALGGGQEARIVLDGAVYTLRVTRQRKLILTK